jgi:ubiquinone/menaquinone biosynthesis C-methylase UbiE
MATMNRRLWNDISTAWQRRRDAEHDARFFQRGGSALFPEVHRLMGPVKRKTLLDLQCGSGEAALSWANRGAIVTGLDYSDRRLVAARRKAQLAGIDVTYVHGNVVRLPFPPSNFDRVFTGGGVTGWIPDMRRWAREIARVLKPGGRFVYSDGHPFLLCLVRRGNRLVLGNAWAGYFDNRPLTWNGMARWMKKRKILPQVERNWTLADRINSLNDAGLKLVRIEELAPAEHWFWVPKGQERAVPRELAMAWDKPRR